MKKGKLIKKLIEIRKDWTLSNYNLWEENGAVDCMTDGGPSFGYSNHDRGSIEEYREYMKDVLTKFKKSELKEIIEDER